MNRYIREEDNVLAAARQITLIFCFIGGGYIEQFAAISDQASPQVASNVMVFASPTVIALPLVIVTFVMVIVLMFIIMVLLRKKWRLSVILLTATNEPPSLKFEEGTRWHLFLSHVWSTGQE